MAKTKQCVRNDPEEISLGNLAASFNQALPNGYDFFAVHGISIDKVITDFPDELANKLKCTVEKAHDIIASYRVLMMACDDGEIISKADPTGNVIVGVEQSNDWIEKRLHKQKEDYQRFGIWNAEYNAAYFNDHLKLTNLEIQLGTDIPPTLLNQGQWSICQARCAIFGYDNEHARLTWKKHVVSCEKTKRKTSA